MQNPNYKSISSIMNKGFEKAAHSFSKLVNRTLSFSHGNIILVHNPQEFSYACTELGNLMVLTTDMIGELPGRSYLILSEHEQAEIYQSVSPAKKMEVTLQEGLLLEIDNIISASVITQIANDLSIKVYGDVPHLQYIKAENIQQFLTSGLSFENSTSILVCNTTFLLDNHGHIHPQFIWKLNTKVFDLLQKQTVQT